MELIHGKQKRLVLMALGVAGLALLAWAGYQFYDGLQSLAKSRRSLRKSASELEALYRRNPFPSEVNVTRLAENATTVTEWNARIVASLVERQPFGKDETLTDAVLTPAQFIQRLNRVRRGLIEKAPSHRVRIVKPDEMWFGYEEFSGGQLPASTMDEQGRRTAVKLMFEQLGQIEDLVLLLYEAGIYELESVKREQVYSPGTSETPEQLTGEGQIPEGELFGRFRMSFTFKTLESGLVSVLNRLSERNAFTVVTSLSIQRKDDGIRTGKEEDERAAESARQPSTSPSRSLRDRLMAGQADVKSEGTVPEVSEQAPPAPKPEGAFTRIVSGPSLEEPMDVTLKLSVYKFSGGHGGD